jgi:hypothetical protein
MKLDVLEILGTIAIIVSMFLLSEKIMVAGFIVGIIGNILWILWGMGKVQGAFFVLQISVLVINLRGLIL